MASIWSRPQWVKETIWHIYKTVGIQVIVKLWIYWPGAIVQPYSLFHDPLALYDADTLAQDDEAPHKTQLVPDAEAHQAKQAVISDNTQSVAKVLYT